MKSISRPVTSGSHSCVLLKSSPIAIGLPTGVRGWCWRSRKYHTLTFTRYAKACPEGDYVRRPAISLLGFGVSSSITMSL